MFLREIILTITEVNREYKNQADNINKTVSAYNKSREDYQKNLETSGQIAQAQIKQALILSDEPDAEMEYHGLGDTGDILSKSVMLVLLTVNQSILIANNISS